MKIQVNELSVNDINFIVKFIIQKYDCISFARRYAGYLSLAEYQSMQDEYLNYILEENLKLRQERNKKAEQFLKEDMEGYNEICYEMFRNQVDNRCNSKSRDILECKFTRISPISINSVFEVCSYQLSQEVVENIVISENSFKIYDEIFTAVYHKDNEILMYMIDLVEKWAVLEVTEKEHDEIAKFLKIE